MPFNESLVRHGAPANDWFRREPAEGGRLGRGGARLQHAVPSVARQANGPFAERGIDEQMLEIRAVAFASSGIDDVEPVSATRSSKPARDAAGTARSDPTRTRDRLRPAPFRQIASQSPAGQWTAPMTRASAMLPLRIVAPRRHPTSQDRKTMEAEHPWSGRTKRSPPGVEISRPGALAKLEWLSPPKPRREQPYHGLRANHCGQRMHCVKLLGQRLMARDFDRQVAEIQVRIAVLNGYSALGIPVTEAVG